MVIIIHVFSIYNRSPWGWWYNTCTKNKGTLNYPSIQIVLKDLPLALIRELGHGSLKKKERCNAYILTVNNSEGLILLINLLKKLIKLILHKLIDWYNKYRNTTKKKGTDSLLSNAWLSGFIEADGHFSLRSTESGKYIKIE